MQKCPTAAARQDISPPSRCRKNHRCKASIGAVTTCHLSTTWLRYFVDSTFYLCTTAALKHPGLAQTRLSHLAPFTSPLSFRTSPDQNADLMEVPRCDLTLTVIVQVTRVPEKPPYTRNNLGPNVGIISVSEISSQPFLSTAKTK